METLRASPSRGATTNEFRRGLDAASMGRSDLTTGPIIPNQGRLSSVLPRSLEHGCRPSLGGCMQICSSGSHPEEVRSPLTRVKWTEPHRFERRNCLQGRRWLARKGSHFNPLIQRRHARFVCPGT